MSEYRRYEVGLSIRDPNYTDQLLLSLLRQGYCVYLSQDDITGTWKVYFETTNQEVREIKE
jgi:hypothetical protein